MVDEYFAAASAFMSARAEIGYSGDVTLLVPRAEIIDLHGGMQGATITRSAEEHANHAVLAEAAGTVEVALYTFYGVVLLREAGVR